MDTMVYEMDHESILEQLENLRKAINLLIRVNYYLHSSRISSHATVDGMGGRQHTGDPDR